MGTPDLNRALALLEEADKLTRRADRAAELASRARDVLDRARAEYLARSRRPRPQRTAAQQLDAMHLGEVVKQAEAVSRDAEELAREARSEADRAAVQARLAFEKSGSRA